MTEPRRERCWKCDADHDVDAKGRVAKHQRPTSWTNGVATRFADCDGSRRPSKEEMARRTADRELAIHREIDDVRAEASVAIDAMIMGRGEYADKVARWGWLALWSYRKHWKVPAVYPFRYETKCAASNRRAETRGDVYCRFCGERLLVGVKRPSDVVAESEHAQRHLAACALHVLVGLREMAPPTHKVLPMELAADGFAPSSPIDSGPLFGGGR